jgi:hypothetical protein
MLSSFHEKMAIQESALGGGRFFASNSTVVGNDASTCSDPCASSEDCSTAIRNSSWDNTHTFDLSSRGERSGRKPSVLVQHTHNVHVGVRMAKLATLQLVQLVGARSTTRGPMNQEARAAPPPGFSPHNVECKKGEA